MIIDGAHGGQVLRTAVALSALTGKEITVENIRKDKPNPGLAAQHLAAVRACAQICGADVDGADKGSTSLTFRPGKISGGKFDIDVGTAGSCTLVLQAALIPAMFAEKTVILRIRGGTDVPWSPPFDYWREVFLPCARRFCSKAELSLEKRGYYPAGGGVIELKIVPAIKRSIEPSWERFVPMLAAKRIERTSRGRLLAIKGVAHASASLSKKRAAELMAESARIRFEAMGVPVDIRVEYSASDSPGGGITLWAIFSDGEINDNSPRIGTSQLLAGMPEDAGSQAAFELERMIRAGDVMDGHLSDQLMPYLALSGGEVKGELSSHCKAAIEVAEKMLAVKFETGETIRARPGEDLS